MKVLIVSSSDDNNAHVQRLSIIEEGLKRSGVDTRVLHNGDYFFTATSLIRILNMPFYFKLTRECDVIHGGSTTATFLMAFTKPFNNSKIIYDVNGNAIGEALLRALTNLGTYSRLEHIILRKAFYCDTH
jgi:hypothetical protein